MFYPGNLWIKRVSRLFIICTIGISLFINDLQNILLDIGTEMIELSVSLSDPAVSTAYVMENSIVPALGYIEKSSLGWVITDYGIPDSQSLQKRIDNAYRLKEVLDQYAPIYKNLSLFLKVISWLFWIPIGLSVLWIFMDIKKSSARYFDIFILACAIWFNIWSYEYLHSYFHI